MPNLPVQFQSVVQMKKPHKKPAVDGDPAFCFFFREMWREVGRKYPQLGQNEL